MTFEFIYAVSLWLLLLVYDVVILVRLERKDDLQIAEYLKNRFSIKNVFAGIAVPIIAIFLVPKYFGFKWDTSGSLLGISIFLVWAYLLRAPKWKKLKDRANQAKSEEMGHKGDRVAELKVRRLRNYLSGAWLSIPYLILLGAGIYLLYWAGLQDLPHLGGAGIFIFAQYLLAIGLTLFLYWQMRKLVIDPVDLRSSEPVEFSRQTQVFVKARIRSFLFAQISYLVSALSLIYFLIHGFSGKFWLIATQVPFLVSMLWLSYSGLRKQALLEGQRWQEE